VRAIPSGLRLVHLAQIMNWRYKAAAQGLLSRLPGGPHLNYLLGRYVTGHVLASETTFQHDLAAARSYVDTFQRYGAFPIADALFYEFGAGWDLIVALSLYALGVNRQRLIDVRRLLRPDLVKATANRLSAITKARSDLRLLPEFSETSSWRARSRELAQQCGIEYNAPRDAGATGWADDSISYITTTKVLSFIPEVSLFAILRECHRILHPRGLAAFMIDYRDNYSYSDPTIGPYNFLQFSDESWARVNPPLHYQNRLRHSDYRRLFEKAGFEIVEEHYARPKPELVRTLESIRVDPRFAGYERTDLAAVRGHFVLRKARAAGKATLPRVRRDIGQSAMFEELERR
jgi:hypothetical protein